MPHPASFANRPDGLSPEQRALLAQPLHIPPGYGMRVLSEAQRHQRWAACDEEPAPLDVLLVYESPRTKQHRYVVSVDVSSGTGQDDSVIEVTRVGTIREPEEQVAQFVSNRVDTQDLAHYADAIGRLYTGRDDLPALLAVECNGLGISTQEELIKHIGYPNLFIWQYLDAMPGREMTTRYGWYTSPRSRPIMLANYMHALKTCDPHTGLPDYRINSPHTIAQLGDLVSPGPLWMAEAADGAKDDCVMAGAIGVQVARSLAVAGKETVHETRRRLSEELARASQKAEILGRKISPQTTDVSYDEIMGRQDGWGSGDPEDEVHLW